MSTANEYTNHFSFQNNKEILRINQIPGDVSELNGKCALPYSGAISENLGRLMSRSDINVYFKQMVSTWRYIGSV